MTSGGQTLSFAQSTGDLSMTARAVPETASTVVGLGVFPYSEPAPNAAAEPAKGIEGVEKVLGRWLSIPRRGTKNPGLLHLRLKVLGSEGGIEK